LEGKKGIPLVPKTGKSRVMVDNLSLSPLSLYLSLSLFLSLPPPLQKRHTVSLSIHIANLKKGNDFPYRIHRHFKVSYTGLGTEGLYCFVQGRVACILDREGTAEWWDAALESTAMSGAQGLGKHIPRADLGVLEGRERMTDPNIAARARCSGACP
jgi:hypothetical protein